MDRKTKASQDWQTHSKWTKCSTSLDFSAAAFFLMDLNIPTFRCWRKRRTHLEKKFWIQEPAVIAELEETGTWREQKEKKKTKKPKIQPKTQGLPRSCISSFFTVGSSNPRKEGTAITNQTYKANTYVKDKKEQERSQKHPTWRPLPSGCGGPEGKDLGELVGITLARWCSRSVYPAPDMSASLVNPSLHFKQRIGASNQEDLYART